MYFTVLLSILGVLLVIFLITILVVYKLAFFCPKRSHDDIYVLPKQDAYKSLCDKINVMIKELDSVSYEPVYIKSHDNKKLFARFYYFEDNAPVAICFHGWHGSAIRDFCGGTKLLFELKYNVLIVDQRGQWNSQGHTISFGIKERFDVLSWINYVKERFGNDVKISLYGVSMGSATVLMSTALNLPSNVKAIIADCPYTSGKDIIKKVCKNDMKLPYAVLKPFIFASAFILAHFNLNDKNAYIPNAVKNTKIPILIIHGEEDSFVPCYMSKEIADANQKYITRVTFPNADHALSFMVDFERYKKLVIEFLKKNS